MSEGHRWSRNSRPENFNWNTLTMPTPINFRNCKQAWHSWWDPDELWSELGGSKARRTQIAFRPIQMAMLGHLNARQFQNCVLLEHRAQASETDSLHFSKNETKYKLAYTKARRPTMHTHIHVKWRNCPNQFCEFSRVGGQCDVNCTCTGSRKESLWNGTSTSTKPKDRITPTH